MPRDNPPSSLDFDRLQLILDINTHQENQEFRFGTEHIDAFYGEIHDLHNNIIHEIGEHING